METGGDAHIGGHLREAVRRLGVRPVDFARAVGRTSQTIHSVFAEPSPRLPTLRRYAEALNRFLPEGDPRRFTAESLQRGPEPELPPAESDPRIRMPRDLGETFLSGQQHLTMPPWDPNDVVMVPVYGEVPCGEPLQLEELPLEYWPFHRDALPRGCTERNCLVLRARGHSMAPEILSGDLLLVRKDMHWDVGSIVVANISGNGCTVKRVAAATHGGMELRPDNPAEPAMLLDDGDTVVVLGVLVDWYRSMRGSLR